MADLSKARQLIGYKPRVSLEEGRAETIAWYRNHCLSTARRA